MRYLTFALAKGRLADKTLSLFEQIGITCEEMKDKSSRKLIFTNEELGFPIFSGQGRRCAYLCGIRGCRYWSCRERYASGGGQKVV